MRDDKTLPCPALPCPALPCPALAHKQNGCTPSPPSPPQEIGGYNQLQPYYIANIDGYPTTCKHGQVRNEDRGG